MAEPLNLFSNHQKAYYFRDDMMRQPSVSVVSHLDNAVEDFACAAMLRLLLRGMAGRGLAAPVAVPEGSHVSIADKRALLYSIFASAGPGLLIDLARDVDAIRHEPIHQVLYAAHDAVDLIRRWQRLERYVHSHHKVAVLACDSQHLVLEHRSRRGRQGRPPHPFENLVVLGVLIGAIEALGHRDVRAHVEGVDLYPHRDGAALGALVQRGATAHWQLTWAGGAHRASGQVAERCPGNLCDALPWPALAQQVARVVLRDPGAQPRLGDVSKELNIASRTLQRSLAAHGLSFTDVNAEARLRAAAWWLVHSSISLAEIGFLSGFSDQPHFTRDFQKRVGITPARYRMACMTAPCRESPQNGSALALERA
jgi:AraC-like DNA-binding protein